MTTNNIVKKNNHYEIRDAISPKKTWRSILYISLAILIAGFAYDFYMYKIVSRNPLYVEVPSEEMVIERLGVDKIKSIISFYDSKIEKNAGLKNKNLIDPAL